MLFRGSILTSFTVFNTTSISYFTSVPAKECPNDAQYSTHTIFVRSGDER